jgi:hypothetical protein
MFPGCEFLVGYDTAARLVNPRYYGSSAAARDRALRAIAAARCRFLVAGRLERGAFKTLDDIPLGAGAKNLFAKLPDVRADVSSTGLRSMLKRS